MFFQGFLDFCDICSADDCILVVLDVILQLDCALLDDEGVLASPLLWSALLDHGRGTSRLRLLEVEEGT